MVDTSLRPRPSFGTFLQSDNSKSDGLSYYSYQRLLRSKKVALLQEKKRRSYEPGYLKQTSTSTASPSSRLIFQLKSKQPASLELVRNDKNSETTSDEKDKPLQIPSLVNLDEFSTHRDSEVDDPGLQIQTERLPRIKSKARIVKSATARDQPLQSLPSHAIPNVQKHERPKTVSGVRNKLVMLQSQGVQTDSLTDAKGGKYPSVSGERITEDRVVDMEKPGRNEVDMLAKAYTWRTSSQRATDEVGWNERIPSPSVPCPASTVEQFPDPVSMRLTFRRYHSEPAEWQCVGAEWDSAQSRPGSAGFTRGPQSIIYSSTSRKKQQLPGYYGHVPGTRLMDMYTPTSNSERSTVPVIRCTTPRATNTSRQANIPGYSGCVHWTSSAPAHSNMPLPELTSSARTHRHIPLEEERSPFVRTGVFSKMIKTVSPYNPYNKTN